MILYANIYVKECNILKRASMDTIEPIFMVNLKTDLRFEEGYVKCYSTLDLELVSSENLALVEVWTTPVSDCYSGSLHLPASD